MLTELSSAFPNEVCFSLLATFGYSFDSVKLDKRIQCVHNGSVLRGFQYVFLGFIYFGNLSLKDSICIFTIRLEHFEENLHSHFFSM